MTHFQNELAEHPFLGFLITAIFYLFAIVSNICFVEFPIWFMQGVQIAAWLIAILVGLITIFEWIKKHKWFKKKSK